MKHPDRYTYPAVFTYDSEHEIAVTFPDLPGCATSGSDDIDALAMAREALGGHLWVMEDTGEAIPAPSRVSDVTCDANERVQLVDVYMPAIRLAEVTRSVNRTVTLPAWLNAAALERGVNFSQILQSALMDQFGLTK